MLLSGFIFVVTRRPRGFFETDKILVKKLLIKYHYYTPDKIRMLIEKCNYYSTTEKEEHFHFNDFINLVSSGMFFVGSIIIVNKENLNFVSNIVFIGVTIFSFIFMFKMIFHDTKDYIMQLTHKKKDFSILSELLTDIYLEYNNSKINSIFNIFNTIFN